MTTSDPQTSATLSDLIARFAPQSILTIGPVGEALFDRLDRGAYHWTRCRDLGDFDWQHSQARFDLVILAQVLDSVPKALAMNALARFRDILSRRLLVVVATPIDTAASTGGFTRQDMLAMGLVSVAIDAPAANKQAIYAYDIDSYKTIPEWLNASYWAHPELFNKYWW